MRALIKAFALATITSVLEPFPLAVWLSSLIITDTSACASIPPVTEATLYESSFGVIPAALHIDWKTESIGPSPLSSTTIIWPSIFNDNLAVGFSSVPEEHAKEFSL